MPVQQERHGLPFEDREVGDRPEALAVHRDRRVDLDCIGPRDSAKTILDAAHPGNDASVVEAQRDVHAHHDRPLHTLDQAYQLDAVAGIGGRHEVDDPHGAAIGGEIRLENQRRIAIAPAGRADLLGRRDLPAAVLLGAEQPGKAGRPVESREAKPIDRSVTSDKRGGMRVADQGVVLDAQIVAAH